MTYYTQYRKLNSRNECGAQFNKKLKSYGHFMLDNPKTNLYKVVNSGIRARIHMKILRLF